MNSVLPVVAQYPCCSHLHLPASPSSPIHLSVYDTLAMTENTKPTIVFVPGAWHLPEGFDAVRALLAERGYPTEAVANPSIDAEPPNKHLNDDIEHLRATLNQLTDEGKETVVITHSYGGLVGAGAVEGLELSKRQQNGQAGGVVMLIYMSAFVVPKGSSLKDMLGGQTLPWMKFDVSSLTARYTSYLTTAATIACIRR